MAETNRLEAKRKEKGQKKKKIYIGIGAVIAVILVCFIIHASIMAGRTTYSSEDEMISAVAGTYTHYEVTTCERMYVTSDTVTLWFPNLGEDFANSFEIESWNPSNGTISMNGDTIIVTNTGDLKYASWIYEK